METIGGLSERQWPSIILTPITIDSFGTITVSSTIGLKVKQLCTLSLGPNSQQYQIKKVLNVTQLLVGDPTTSIGKIVVPSAYNGGTLSIPQQERNTIGDTPVLRAAYDEEPTVAFRNVLVDWAGQYYTVDNPLPISVSGSDIVIDSLNVHIDARDDFPNPGDIHDSVRIGNGTYEANVTEDQALQIVPINALIKREYDYISAAYPTTTQEVYSYYLGGSGGTLVGTVTVNYTNASKTYFLNAAAVNY
jgi:hypothetical protein